MPKHQSLLSAPPYPVESAIRRLGSNLRIARLRRNRTIEEVAEAIGVSRYAVADAEKGKTSTGIAIYFALLWSYGLIDQVSDLAAPSRDEEGLSLSLLNERQEARHGREMDNDF